MKSFGFHEQFRKSREGVLLTALYLLNRPGTKDVAVLDTENDAQKKGYDLMVTHTGDKERQYVEVKTDFYTTGNVFLETVSSSDAGKPGCFLSSLADVWAYYLTALDKMLMFTLARVREEIMERHEEEAYREARPLVWGRDGGYVAEGLVVPIRDVAASDFCTEISNFRSQCQAQAA